MNLKPDFIKADIEILKQRKEKLQKRIKEAEFTLKGINYKIGSLNRLLLII